jgi:hypothetical protein
MLSDKMATTLLYWEDPVASGVVFASVLGNIVKRNSVLPIRIHLPGLDLCFFADSGSVSLSSSEEYRFRETNILSLIVPAE